MYNHWMQELSSVSKLTTNNNSASAQLKRMGLENVTFTRSIHLKACSWQGRHGSMWMMLQFGTAGIIPKLKGQFPSLIIICIK